MTDLTPYADAVLRAALASPSGLDGSMMAYLDEMCELAPRAERLADEAEILRYSAEDWKKEAGPRSQNRWVNVHTQRVVYIPTNPGLGKGKPNQPPAAEPAQPQQPKADPVQTVAGAVGSLNSEDVTPQVFDAVANQAGAMSHAQIQQLREHLEIPEKGFKSGTKSAIARKLLQAYFAKKAGPAADPRELIRQAILGKGDPQKALAAVDALDMKGLRSVRDEIGADKGGRSKADVGSKIKSALQKLKANPETARDAGRLEAAAEKAGAANLPPEKAAALEKHLQGEAGAMAEKAEKPPTPKQAWMDRSGMIRRGDKPGGGGWVEIPADQADKVMARLRAGGAGNDAASVHRDLMAGGKKPARKPQAKPAPQPQPTEDELGLPSGGFDLADMGDEPVPAPARQPQAPENPVAPAEKPAAAVPAGASKLPPDIPKGFTPIKSKGDPSIGMAVNDRKELQTTNPADPGKVRELAKGLKHALSEGLMYAESKEDLIPMGLFVRLVQKEHPEATTGDVYSALKQLQKDFSIDINILNEHRLVGDPDQPNFPAVPGAKAPTDSFIYRDGRPGYYVHPRKGRSATAQAVDDSAAKVDAPPPEKAPPPTPKALAAKWEQSNLARTLKRSGDAAGDGTVNAKLGTLDKSTANKIRGVLSRMNAGQASPEDLINVASYHARKAASPTPEVHAQVNQMAGEMLGTLSDEQAQELAKGRQMPEYRPMAGQVTGGTYPKAIEADLPAYAQFLRERLGARPQ